MKKKIRISFRNGLTFADATSEILSVVDDLYNFEESANPDYILFGPYGIDVPPPGNYTRIGYFCENITPDLSVCEWAFGVPLEKEINHPKYRRIKWHGLDPHTLVKTLDDNDIDRLVNSNRKFCNFTYSNPIPYREEFFRQLSKYKKVDAPGRSMNNRPSFDNDYTGSVWERKRKFLADYKFTIAFESYVYPGYQTEKLYDAMQQNSLPIYCGDPCIGEIFNTQSFINVFDHTNVQNNSLIRWLEKTSQQDFDNIRPQYLKSPGQRVERKLKSLGRQLKMKLQFNNLDFSDLIDRIIEIDRSHELYREYLKQPWFLNNTPPEHLSLRDRWIEIFEN